MTKLKIFRCIDRPMILRDRISKPPSGQVSGPDLRALWHRLEKAPRFPASPNPKKACMNAPAQARLSGRHQTLKAQARSFLQRGAKNAAAPRPRSGKVPDNGTGVTSRLKPLNAKGSPIAVSPYRMDHVPALRSPLKEDSKPTGRKTPLRSLSPPTAMSAASSKVTTARSPGVWPL